MKATALLVCTLLASTAAHAAEPEKAPGPPQRGYSGIFSHGDSSGFMEDAYGGSVERSQPEPPSGESKRDPAIRWDAPGAPRR